MGSKAIRCGRMVDEPLRLKELGKVCGSRPGETAVDQGHGESPLAVFHEV